MLGELTFCSHARSDKTKLLCQIGAFDTQGKQIVDINGDWKENSWQVARPRINRVKLAEEEVIVGATIESDQRCPVSI